MLILFIIIAVLFVIGALFYKQSIQEYRINQIEWEQRHELDSLLEERAPIVVTKGTTPSSLLVHAIII